MEHQDHPYVDKQESQARSPLGVDEEVEQGIHDVELVVGDVAHGLLAHGALVGVARRLVVVRVGDEARHHAQHRERLYLQVRCRHTCVHPSFHRSLQASVYWGRQAAVRGNSSAIARFHSPPSVHPTFYVWLFSGKLA